MTYETILFDVTDNVAVITLNRPDLGNALNPQMTKDLHAASLECDSNPDIRAMVFTGKGKLFSGGGDLVYFANEPNLRAALLDMTTHLHMALSRFARMDAPTIAAVNGTAGGGGFSMMCACDMAIAAESAKFSMAYTAAALTPDASSTYYLPRLIGQRRANEMALTNRRLTAQEALDWGLINQVVPAEDLMETAMSLAKKLAQGPTAAFGRTKQLLRTSLDNSLETQMENEAQAISYFAGQPNAIEGIKAFLEKRRPNFK